MIERIDVMGAGTRSVAAVALAGLLGFAVAGCGAGQDAATSLDLPSVPGVNVAAEDESVLVRNAVVVFSPEGYAAGDTAPVQLWLVNNTHEPIQLVEASSAQASSVQGAEATIPPVSLIEVTLELDGLRQQVGGANPDTEAFAPLPIELRFDNGAELTLQVTMAPPLEAQPRESMELGGH